MKYIHSLIFLSLFFVADVVAKNYEFTHRQIVASSIDNSAPQLFLFNNQGELIHYSNSYLPNILSIFRKKAVLTDSEKIKQNLFDLLSEQVDFTEHQYTLFYTSIEEAVGPCKPCRQQEEKIALLETKLSKEKLLIHSITIINEVYEVQD